MLWFREKPRRAGKKGFGWIPDHPDVRDHRFTAHLPKLGSDVRLLPPSVDLRPSCPPIYDQGELGSCTANAIAFTLQFDKMKEKLADVSIPSRLFIYYNERVIEGTVRSDAGAAIRDGMKVISKIGDCPESMWPYVECKFAKRPAVAAYESALKHTALNYGRLHQTLPDLKQCLSAGFPFVCGITVYDSFESDAVARDGVVPLPDVSKEKDLGGHAVAVVGYDDIKQSFLMRNSWGSSWGISGYCWIPYGYILDPNLSCDRWAVKVVA